MGSHLHGAAVSDGWQPKPGDLVRVKSLKVSDSFGVVTWAKCSRVVPGFGVIRVFADNREIEVWLTEVEEIS